jgi:hypothetical protein
MPSFSLRSLSDALKRIVQGFTTPGGYLGPRSVTSPQYLLASPALLLAGAKFTPSGPQVETAQAEPGQAPAAPAVGFMEGMSVRPEYVFGRPTTKATETTKVPTPASVPKAEITTAKPAPTPTPTPPPPTPPPVAGGGGAPTPPATAPGFTAPTLSSLPPAPVQISERAFTGIPSPRPEIPVGQFEAMIRALAELTGGRYVPTPLPGATPFGPTGALERALRRLRERELGIGT